jgi:phosphotransferase family enzyme
VEPEDIRTERGRATGGGPQGVSVKNPQVRVALLPELPDTLAGPRAAMDPEQVKMILVPLLKHYLGPLQVNSVNIEVLQSKNSRCLLRYELQAFAPTLAMEMRRSVIGKVVRPGLGEHVFANMRQLWAHGFARGAKDGISMPEPLGFVRSWHLLVQEEVPGTPVKELVKQSPQPEHFRQLARVLAKLHTCRIVPTKTFTVRDHLLRCHPEHELLAMACPQLAPSIEYLVEKAYQIEAKLGAVPYTPIHGDFDLEQVHLQNGYAWLMDFDAVCYADPAADLGSVLVSLKGTAGSHPEIKALTEAFLAEYFSRVDRAIAARVPLYEALSHLRRACKCLRFHEEGWERAVARMVEAGVASINEMEVMGIRSR